MTLVSVTAGLQAPDLVPQVALAAAAVAAAAVALRRAVARLVLLWSPRRRSPTRRFDIGGALQKVTYRKAAPATADASTFNPTHLSGVYNRPTVTPPMA